MSSSKSRDNLQELWGRIMIGEEALPGGRARNKKPSDFDPDELAAGIKVEQEHLVGDGYSKQEAEDIAREIAMDHLTEIPDYYTRLDKMESESGVKVAAVPKKYEHIDFTPPKGVAEAAAKGLELRQKASPSNRGGLTPAEASKHGIGSGVQRAVNLKNRDKVSPKVIKQMRGFLSRSEKSSKISPENKDTPWNDKGYVAWLLWGGDPAKAWVSKVIKQMEAADEKEKQSKQAALMERWGSMLVVGVENEPTNPGLWAKVQALAKGEQASMTHGGKTVNGPNDGKGFTVFPSAYANGWSSKVYKDLGGGWKKKAGWWKSESGITGDGPADAMQEAVDTIRSMYLDHPEIDREPTLSELWDTLGFVTGPGVESGEIRVKMAAETGDGSEHVGVFAPLPPEIASQFPTKEEDSSRPHVTLCYIGPVPDKQDQEALVEAVRDLYSQEVGPIKAHLSGVDYFRHANGSVAYAKVVFSKDMGHLKDRLKSLLEERGVEVHDQHPLAFNPHVTLAYYDDPHAVWDGPVPKGSWTFNEVEVWGLPEVHRLPIGKSLSAAWGPTFREAARTPWDGLYHGPSDGTARISDLTFEVGGKGPFISVLVRADDGRVGDIQAVLNLQSEVEKHSVSAAESLRDLGERVGRPNMGVYTVAHSGLWDTFRGYGVGKRAYMVFMREAYRRGHAVGPDASWTGRGFGGTSADAQRVWEKISAMPGVEVATGHPFYYGNPKDERVGPDRPRGFRREKKRYKRRTKHPNLDRVARGKAKKDVGHGGLDEWFSGHGGNEGEATWGDWVAISPVTKTLPSGKKVEKGDIIGECGISDDPDWKDVTKGGEDPLKCMPRQKAYDMPKAERAEKAEKKYEAEKSDSNRGKAPTMTPTFEKSSSDQHMAQIELMKFLSGVAKKERVGDHVYVVGGAVRNFVIDRPIKDIDVVIDAVALGERFRRPHDSEWFASTLQRYIPAMTSLTTNQYGVAILTVKGDWYLGGHNLNGEVIEIANARKESYGGGEGKGYKPDQVVPATIEEDLLRREFTFNTLLWRLQDLASGPEKAEIIDLTGCGLKDLNNMTMQCPRDPDVVFADDPTRMLRAIKFSTKYGFKVPEDLAASIRKNAAKMKQAPWEAIASIFINNVLNEPTAPSALRQMKSLGLLDVVAEMVQEQKPFAAYLSKQLRNRGVSLLLDLLELGLSDPSPLKFLSGDQQKKLREITTSMGQEEADAFAAYLAKPTVDNKSLISDFNLTGPDRALPIQYAREALLENPNLARNSMALDKTIRKLMDSEGHPKTAKSLNEKWGGLLYESAETSKIAKEIKSIWLVNDPGPHSEIIDIVVELSDWDTLRNIMVGMRDWRKSNPAFHDGEDSALKDAESRLKKMHGGEIPEWVMENAQQGFKMAGISKIERKREILARLRSDWSKSHG